MRPAGGDVTSGVLWRAYCEDSSLRAATMGTGWRTYMLLSGAYVTKTLGAARKVHRAMSPAPPAPGLSRDYLHPVVPPRF